MTKNVLKLNDLRSETDLIDKHSGYDLIFLNDFMLEANIGVYKHEKEGTQPLRINVVAKVKNPKKINDSNLQVLFVITKYRRKLKKLLNLDILFYLKNLQKRYFKNALGIKESRQ